MTCGSLFLWFSTRGQTDVAWYDTTHPFITGCLKSILRDAMSSNWFNCSACKMLQLHSHRQNYTISRISQSQLKPEARIIDNCGHDPLFLMIDWRAAVKVVSRFCLPVEGMRTLGCAKENTAYNSMLTHNPWKELICLLWPQRETNYM